MDADFRHNIGEVERGMSDFARKQLPFSVSQALNATAGEVGANTVKRMARKLDRPTPFTLKGFLVRRTTKTRQAAAVFAKDIRGKYRRILEEGGTHFPKPGRTALVLPARIRLNRYGNMARGAVWRALARDKVFSGDPRGARPGGIYERTGRGGRGDLRMLAGYTKRARYRPQFGFRDAARKTALAWMPRHFEEAMRRAVATARR